MANGAANASRTLRRLGEVGIDLDVTTQELDDEGIKKIWGSRVTTVFVRQGHYALDSAEVARHPSPDVTVGRIGELMHLPMESLVGAAR